MTRANSQLLASSHCAILLVLTAAITAAGDPRQERPSIDLAGAWQFQIDPDDRGLVEKWYEDAKPFGRTIIVPGAWNAQGVEFETPAQLERYLAHPPEAPLAGPVNEAAKLFHVYPGPAWYRRSVDLPAQWLGKTVWLRFGGVHRSAQVWVDGQFVGAHTGYVVPFQLDVTRFVTPGRQVTFTVRVDARRSREADPLLGCMDTLDFLYVTWGGIHRGVSLEATADTWIADLQVVPQVERQMVDLHITPATAADAPVGGELHVSAQVLDGDGRVVANGSEPWADVQRPVKLSLPISSPKLWSPAQPHLYTSRVTLVRAGVSLDTRSARFGMRQFQVRGGQFLLNGQPIFLRGYGDDCIYPNTISPPVDKEEYRRRFQVVKDYGFNYVRHHSWTPIEEYLEVADEMGMLLQPEFPIAYRWDLAQTDQAKAQYIRLWQELIRAYRNHPSIVAWCMGNELYDGFPQAPEMYQLAKQLDPTRPVIDSDGVSRKPRATLDFWVWQFGEAGSFGLKDDKYSFGQTEKPVVAHEMGYFVTLPDLTQQSLFAGGLKPYWLDEARANAQNKGVLDQYAEWLDRSNRLQAICLKTNTEAARRSRLQGYHVWLFQDYPWCAEGVVDMFYRPKAIRGEQFRQFNAPTVLLIGQDTRNCASGQSLEVPLFVSRYEQPATSGALLRWRMLAAGNEVLVSGEQAGLEVPCGQLKQLLTIACQMPRRPVAEKLQLNVQLTDEHGTIENSWDFWLFPDERPQPSHIAVVGSEWLRSAYPWTSADIPAPHSPQGTLLVTDTWNRRVMDYLRAGGSVCLLNAAAAFPSVTSGYRPSGWDPGSREAHLGTVFDPQHPALQAMPSDGWCDLQFHELVHRGQTILLEEMPGQLQPIVRVIDMPQRLWNKALLFEARVGQGRMLVSGFNFAHALPSGDPAACFFLDRLIQYAARPEFQPAQSIAVDYLEGRL